MDNKMYLTFLKQAVIALGLLDEPTTRKVFDELVFAIGGALMFFMKLEKTRNEIQDKVAKTIEDLVQYIHETKGHGFDKRKIKSKFKAIYEALNSDKDFTKVEDSIDFTGKADQVINAFRNYLLEFLNKNIDCLDKRPRSIEDDIMFEATKIVAKNFQEEQEDRHLEFVKEELVPDLRESTDFIRSKHQEILSILSRTKTQLEPSPNDEDFIFYYVGINHMIREIMVDIIQMIDSNDIDPYKIITNLHNIQLLNNAHLFDEKYKILQTFGKENKQ